MMRPQAELAPGRRPRWPYAALLFAALMQAVPQSIAAQSNRPQPPPGSQPGPGAGAERSTQPEADLLEPGRTVTREFPPSGRLSFRLRLKADQYVRLDWTGHDSPRLIAPDGREAKNFSFGLNKKSTVIAQASGEYRLDFSKNQNSRGNLLTVGYTELRGAVDRYARYYRGYLATEPIGPLYARQTPEAMREGLARCAEALALLEGADDFEAEGFLHYHRGLFHTSLGEHEAAVAAHEQAIRRYRAAGDEKYVAIATHGLANAYSAVSDFRRAVEHLRRVLPPHLADGDTSSAGWTLVDLATNHHLLGERQEALDLARQALAQYRKIRVEDNLTEHHRGQGLTLDLMARIHASRGEMQQSLDCLRAALAHFRAAGDAWGEPRVWQQFGAVYAALGDTAQARESYRRALAGWERFSSPLGKAATLNSLGALHLSEGETAQALTYFHQALTLTRSVKDRRGLATTLNNIGRAETAAGNHQLAADYYSRALALYREIGDRSGEALALGYLGLARHRLNDPAAARELLRQALALHRAVFNRDGEAATLYHLARLERERGDYETARAYISAALGLVEFVRSNVLSRELRASYLATVRDYYEFQIDLLMEQSRTSAAPGEVAAFAAPPAAPFAAEALHVNERAQARSLLELLAEARADIRQGLPPDLAGRERALRQRLNDKAEYQTRLLSRRHTPEQAEAAAKELSALTAEYAEVNAQIRAASPRYAALTEPRPLTVAEIQRELLDADTLLLAYALGAERSYLWAVTPASLKAYELAPRAEIERAARRARVRRADAAYPAAAAELSRLILAPAAPLSGHKRLLIVPQGALQFVPFAALPAPENGEREKPKMRQPGRPPDSEPGTPNPFTPLLVNHEIVSVPSASALAFLRRSLADRRAAPKTVAVIADPVFSADDERVTARPASTTPSEGSAADKPPALRDVTRALADISGGRREEDFTLARLFGTRQEAEDIAALVPAAERLTALDFAASRATATSASLGQYRILHFASHALVNDVHPELSGLVLSLVNERGEPQDGFLRAHELFNLKLPAELVVLSACQTGLGKEIRGEGMVGLTQGFMYAGARRVVVSLWPLDDRATARLMRRFYLHLLGPAKLPPAAALRAAQAEMWRDNWKPFHWAAFTLQGEW